MTEPRNEAETEEYCTCRAPHGTRSGLTCGLAWGEDALLDDEIVPATAEDQRRTRGETVIRTLLRTIDRRTNQFLRDVQELRRLGLVPVEFSTHAPVSARALALNLKRQLADWGPALLGDPLGPQLATEMIRDFLDTQRAWVEEPLRTARELSRRGVQSVAPVVSGSDDPRRTPPNMRPPTSTSQRLAKLLEAGDEVPRKFRISVARLAGLLSVSSREIGEAISRGEWVRARRLGSKIEFTGPTPLARAVWALDRAKQ